MSYITYLASDEPIPKIINPFMKISQSGDVLIFKSENDLYFPSVYPFKKSNYSYAINSDKSFFAEIELNRELSEVGQEISFILKFIKDSLLLSSEIELWRVWLGSEDINSNPIITKLSIKDLDFKKLLEFFQIKNDVACMKIVS